MRTISVAAVVSVAFMGSALAVEPDKIDWSKVPATELTLFYPGQGSWEWLNSASHKAGATGVRDGKACRDCHAGEEKDIGDAIAAGKKLEPTPIPGKSGTAKVSVQAAFDSNSLYLRAHWVDDGKPGIHYPGRVFKAGKWESIGNHRGEAKVAAGEQPAVYEDRISFMIGDGKGVPEFKTSGCWATCHNDMRYMPNQAKKDEVEAHPVWGKEGAKKSDIRKYLKDYRTALDDTGGWKNPKSKAEIDALMAKGYFLDLLQWRAHRTNPVGTGDDGFVAEYRNFDAGKKNFVANWDSDKKEPKWMLDSAKTGGKAILAAADLNSTSNWLTDANAVAYNPAVAAKEGAVLPQWLVTGRVDGSYGDVSFAKGSHDGKGWTVVMARKLATGNKDDLQMAAGQTYMVGVAIHDGDTTARWHHVGFPVTLSLGNGNGDINAVALK